MTKSCMYHGHKEKCLLTNKYPVTKNGKLSCKRVKAAEVYGSKAGIESKLKKRDLCKWVFKCTKNSKVCPGR